MSAYWIGTYCPRGGGHVELYDDPEYDGSCGSKGWDLYLDAEHGDEELPRGEWRPLAAGSEPTGEAVRALRTAAEVVLLDNGIDLAGSTEGLDPNLGELLHCWRSAGTGEQGSSE